MTIVFQNDGEIDVQAITTMGVSVKDEGAIGFFGTGLKYALAVLLRNRQKVTILVGEKPLIFTTQDTTIRGREFQLVCMNQVPLGFTTELGKTWEMWMAFRELYCNCKDEGGKITDGRGVLSHIAGKQGKTTIMVEGDLFRAEYFNRHENFIEGTPIFSDGNVEVYDQPTAYIFYKGVRVQAANGRPQFTYNLINQLDLTEDRTMKYHWEGDGPIARCLMQMPDEVACYKAICAPQGSYERTNLAFNADKWSPEFEKIAVREYKADSLKTNSSILKFIHKINPSGLYIPAPMTSVQQKQLGRALAFCEHIGYSPAEYEMVVVETLGPSVMAQALRPERKIVISKQCFDKGTKHLASTLIEEIIHLREGLDDETRNLQTYLFDKIISLGEELQGEPL